MRVTTNMFPNKLIDQLGRLTQQQTRLQAAITSGQKIETPADDPAAMRRVLTLQAEAKAQNQYLANLATLNDRAEAAQVSMKGLKLVSDRASEIATLSGGAQSPADLKTYAVEIKQLIERAVDSANARHGGDYLFGGTNTGQAPFTITRDADGWITGVAYQGNATAPEAEIGLNEKVSAHVPGANTTNAGPRGLLQDSRVGADFFQHLIDLQKHLRDGQASPIAQTDLGNLAKDEDNLIFHISANGALQARLEASKSLLTDRNLTLESAISKETDIDLSEALVKLNQTQTAYQAALQSGASLLTKSLLDYLR